MSQKILNALLFDTRSIQRYIYSGNKLRTNIGASYIVDCIFRDILINKVLKNMFPDDDFADNSHWDYTKDKETPWQNMKYCCVAYVGGGNALLLFDSSKEDKRTEVTKRFTRQLLTARPGLRIGTAQGKLTLNVETQTLNQNEIDSLYSKLKENQNTIFPAVNVPYTGLTLSCEVNGETANFCDNKGIVKANSDIRFYSQEIGIKSKFANKANEDLKNRFIKIFELKKSSVKIDDYQFPMQFEDLGQKEKNNYFAIVHIDGNNMGLKFRTCSTLSDRRKLSCEIKRKTEGAFADLLIKIIQMIKDNSFGDAISLKSNNLPIRPLIIGGDDITFVCPATMAIMFTKTLMEFMINETPKDSPEHLTSEISRSMDCCAGIAIIPTAYPFFRGYTLTEQLCDSAKKSMRLKMKPDDIKSGSSWLDFAILHGEQAPTLNQIRDREYIGARGYLNFGPYRLANGSAKTSDRHHNIENLTECTRQLLQSKCMAKNKIKELRNILQYGKDEAARFLQQLHNQNQDLPKITDWKDYLTDYCWSKEKIPQTPYVDAIELMDFYVPEVVDKWQNLM